MKIRKIRCTAQMGDCDCDICFKECGTIIEIIHLQDCDYLVICEESTTTDTKFGNDIRALDI